jgi:hypothetical protein
MYFEDNTNAEVLMPNGSWEPIDAKRTAHVRAQEMLYKHYKYQNETNEKARKNTQEFEVRRK